MYWYVQYTPGRQFFPFPVHILSSLFWAPPRSRCLQGLSRHFAGILLPSNFPFRTPQLRPDVEKSLFKTPIGSRQEIYPVPHLDVRTALIFSPPPRPPCQGVRNRYHYLRRTEQGRGKKVEEIRQRYIHPVAPHENLA